MGISGRRPSFGGVPERRCPPEGDRSWLCGPPSTADNSSGLRMRLGSSHDRSRGIRPPGRASPTQRRKSPPAALVRLSQNPLAAFPVDRARRARQLCGFRGRRHHQELQQAPEAEEARCRPGCRRSASAAEIMRLSLQPACLITEDAPMVSAATATRSRGQSCPGSQSSGQKPTSSMPEAAGDRRHRHRGRCDSRRLRRPCRLPSDADHAPRQLGGRR